MQSAWCIVHSGCSINICWMSKWLSKWIHEFSAPPRQSSSSLVFPTKHFLVRSFSPSQPSHLTSPQCSLHCNATKHLVITGTCHYTHWYSAWSALFSWWSSSVALSCFTNPVTIIPGHTLVPPIDSATGRIESWDSVPLFGSTVPPSSSVLA